MALYVTVCLLAALTALQNVVAVPGRVLGLVWGTTIGLALAHLFAFRIAGRLVQDGRLAKGDQIASGVQLAAAAAVGSPAPPNRAGCVHCCSALAFSLSPSSSQR